MVKKIAGSVFKYLKQKVYGKTFEAAPCAPRIKVCRNALSDEETVPQTHSLTSKGLLHFLKQLPGTEGRRIFDLGGLVDSNARYWSERGARVHAVDLLHSFDNERARIPHGRFDDLTAQRFVDEYLSFQAGMFDGILVWDVLHFLDVELLHRSISRLAEIVRPGGVVLCFFHNQPKGERIPVCRYAIESTGAMERTIHCHRVIPTTLTNRNIEMLFRDFSLAKFFLSRDSLREVIAVR